MPMKRNSTTLPPLTANFLQACHYCYKNDIEEDVKISKCSRCKSVGYCGEECQKADWKNHRGLCKAYASLEKDARTRWTLLSSVDDRCHTDMELVNRLCRRFGRTERHFLKRALKRPLTNIEQNIVGWQRSCMACARTDRVIRMESTTSPRRELKECPDCGLTFYCCQEHWDAVYPLHAKEPFEGTAYEGKTQCKLNQEIRVDIDFHQTMSEDGRSLGWLPKRSKPEWKPLRLPPKNWLKEFGKDFLDEYGMDGANTIALQGCLRSASDALSMPMTTLYVLQIFNGADDSWTKKTSMTVHVLGAARNETLFAQMFEEIIHRLPALKTLHVLLCGPKLNTVENPRPGTSLTMESCPDCTEKHRVMSVEVQAHRYHEYVEKAGRKYTKPDLAIAFNNGSIESHEQWQDTMELLVDEGVPSVFTSYTRDEAVGEATLLRLAGAKLIPGLGPRRNPWASAHLQLEPNRVTGYFSDNAWFSGGFRGRD
uniref:MYND-type domain-containing protein n=1 Tax=Moniliophthora roreri TaxID=221103 RepID=A0A0W0FPE7_MONRR